MPYQEMEDAEKFNLSLQSFLSGYQKLKSIVSILSIFLLLSLKQASKIFS